MYLLLRRLVDADVVGEELVGEGGLADVARPAAELQLVAELAQPGVLALGPPRRGGVVTHARIHEVVELARRMSAAWDRGVEIMRDLAPHVAGEPERLLDIGVAEALGIIPVLQGDPTLIGFPDRRVSLNLTGTSVHALAGSGEVMAGTIAAMYSLGLPLEEAVKTGVFLHGAAGDSAARGRDPGGIDTRTLLEQVPVAAEALRDHYDDIRAEGPGTIEVI